MEINMSLGTTADFSRETITKLKSVFLLTAALAVGLSFTGCERKETIWKSTGPMAACRLNGTLTVAAFRLT